jgi:hypothetical protein
MATGQCDQALYPGDFDADPFPAWFLDWFLNLPRARQHHFIAFCQCVSKGPSGAPLPTFEEWWDGLLSSVAV